MCVYVAQLLIEPMEPLFVSRGRPVWLVQVCHFTTVVVQHTAAIQLSTDGRNKKEEDPVRSSLKVH